MGEVEPFHKNEEPRRGLKGGAFMRMFAVFGKMLEIAGYFCFFAFGLLGLILCLSILYTQTGFWGLVLGFSVLPTILLLTPWYALIVWGDLLPLIVVYRGMIVSGCLVAVGGWLKDRAGIVD